MSETTTLDLAVEMLRERATEGRDRTHWQGCEADHWQCATLAVLDELARLQAENERLRGTLLAVSITLTEVDGLFADIRDDWTDPRHECRAGRAACAAVSDVIRRALTGEPTPQETR